MIVRHNTPQVPFVDFLIINAPALAFLLLLLASLTLAIWMDFPLAFLPLALGWWAACGAFMLIWDFFKRKKALYLRLRSPGPPAREAPVSRSLRQTPCGYAVWAAALRYARTNRT